MKSYPCLPLVLAAAPTRAAAAESPLSEDVTSTLAPPSFPQWRHSEWVPINPLFSRVQAPQHRSRRTPPTYVSHRRTSESSNNSRNTTLSSWVPVWAAILVSHHPSWSASWLGVLLKKFPCFLDADALFVLPPLAGILKGYVWAVLTPNVVELKRLALALALQGPMVVVKGEVDTISGLAGPQPSSVSEGSPRRVSGTRSHSGRCHCNVSGVGSHAGGS